MQQGQQQRQIIPVIPAPFFTYSNKELTFDNSLYISYFLCNGLTAPALLSVELQANQLSKQREIKLNWQVLLKMKLTCRKYLMMHDASICMIKLFVNFPINSSGISQKEIS